MALAIIGFSAIIVGLIVMFKMMAAFFAVGIALAATVGIPAFVPVIALVVLYFTSDAFRSIFSTLPALVSSGWFALWCFILRVNADEPIAV